MDALFPVLIALMVVIILTIFILGISSAKKKIKKKPVKPKNKLQIISEANKKLSLDPNNILALTRMGDVYFADEDYEAALPLFEKLCKLSASHSGIETWKVNLKHGICAFHCNDISNAVNSLMISKNLNPDTYEVNYYLAKCLHILKDYEKAVTFAKKAIVIDTESTEAQELLARIYFDDKKYSQAITYIKRVLSYKPEDKEFLYFMAYSFNETGNMEKGIKVFMHLRTDPVYGAQSCLACGKFHLKRNMVDAAMRDFELGIKGKDVPKDIMLEMKYRLAICQLKSNDIPTAVDLLTGILTIDPNYRDVQALISKYQEMTQNSNLRVYMMGSSSEFVSVCRKLVENHFPNSHVVINNVEVTSECAEVLSEIGAEKWEDTVIFRFYKSTGTLGEANIRDFYSKVRGDRVGRGICYTAGNFSDEAHSFINGRPIDLLDKTKLVRALSSIQSFG